MHKTSDSYIALQQGHSRTKVPCAAFLDTYDEMEGRAATPYFSQPSSLSLVIYYYVVESETAS
jgi:hypothetical protein